MLKSTKKVILLDVDDVLLNWLEAFERYMIHQGYSKPDGYHTWDLEEAFETSKEEAQRHIKIFNNGHWEFGTLGPIPGSQEGVDSFKKAGYDLVAITSCSTNPQTIALRKANLYWCFGDVFKAVHCVNLGESKDTHLADYEPTWWIEDKMTNAVAGLKYGHKSVLLSRQHNLNNNHEDVIRVENWNEITSLVLGE